MFYVISGHGRLYTLSQLKTHAAGLAGAAFPRRSALDFRTGALVGAGGRPAALCAPWAAHPASPLVPPSRRRLKRPRRCRSPWRADRRRPRAPGKGSAARARAPLAPAPVRSRGMPVVELGAIDRGALVSTSSSRSASRRVVKPEATRERERERGGSGAADMCDGAAAGASTGLRNAAATVLSRKGWALGLGLVFAVAVIWVAASYVVKAVVSAESGMRPLLFTYICNTLFVVYVPIFELLAYWKSRRDPQRWRPALDDATETPRPRMTVNGTVQTPQYGLVNAEEEDMSETAAILSAVGGGSDGSGSAGQHDRVAGGRAPPDRIRTAKLSLLVAPVWFFAQFLFNRSLQLTSVTSNTVLSSASSVLTFLLSVVVLKERFTFAKLGAVLLCVLGTVLVGLADKKEGGKNTVLGDLFCLLSACAYAVYTLLLRVKLPESNEHSMMLFFGYMGVCNAVLFAPWLTGEVLAGQQSLASVSASAYRWTVGKGLVDNVLSDYLWAWAVLLTTPTVATIGLSIQIPFAMVAAALFEHVAPSTDLLLGALLITASFTAINLASDPEKGDARAVPASDAGPRENAVATDLH